MAPEHEAQLTRQSWRSCLDLLRHPTQLHTFIRTSITSTRDYYAARDVADLERGELIRIISWTRRTAMKMTGSVFFLGVIVCLALVTSCRADSSIWQPDDFDWDALQVAPKEHWTGLYLNLTENPLPADSDLMAVGRAGEIDGHRVLFVGFSLGLAWQVVKGIVGAASFALTIKGCVTNDGSAEEIVECVLGVAGTAFSIGTAFKAARNAGWFARAANTWDGSGLERIDLQVFGKRGLREAVAQARHDDLMRHVIRRSFGAEPEFLGYVHDAHRLGKRDSSSSSSSSSSDGGEHLHPFAPLFRFAHPTRGLIDVASREHADNSTRFTLSYANFGLERRQSFQHEHLSDHVLEGRFDGDAARADPAGVSFDAAGGYRRIEDGIRCFVAGDWPAGKALSAQFYDTAHKATFGFGTVGVFENRNNDADLQAFSPRGMPLPQPSC